MKKIKAAEKERLKTAEKGAVEKKHGYGSPFLHIYRTFLQKAGEFYESEAANSFMDQKTRTEALAKDLNRIGSLSPALAEKGIRVCRAQEAHKGSNKVKIYLELDNQVTVGDQRFFLQEILVDYLEKSGADLRFGPAPPSDKERRLRALINQRRATAARKRF